LLSSTTSAAAPLGTVQESSGLVNISNGQMITPAQAVALVQATGSGYAFLANQSLNLSASGAAIGGTVQLQSNNVPSGGFTNLVVPGNVNAVAGIALTAANLTVSGSLTGTMQVTAGNFYNFGTETPA